MVKYMLIFTVLLFISNTWAKPKSFLVCLGTEEAYYHKHKIGGAYNKLNQEIISAVIQLGDKIELQPRFEKAVCSKKYVSLELLKFLLLEKKSIFKITNSIKNIQQRAVYENLIHDLHEKSIYIFIDFINSLQAQMPKSNCLKKKIPELKPFFDQLRYTIEEVGIKKIFKQLKRPSQIFKKLENYELLFKC